MNSEQWPWAMPQPGIYFNMPFPEYLGIKCLSNSGIKDLLVHHSNFWANSWMNPRLKKRDSPAFLEGRVYHKRVLEGKAAFYNEYAAEYDDDPSDKKVIRNSMQIREALRQLSLPVTFTNKRQGIERLMKAHPAAKVLEVLQERHRQKYAGKELIPYDLIYDAEIGARAIESNEYLKSWLVGGYPEVTIIWYDDEYKVWFKCRFDYLKIGAAADLKTVKNETGRDFVKALDYEIASRKYIIQPALYLRGATAAQEHIKKGRIFGADAIPTKWLELFIEKSVEEFRFIFHQKGQAVVTEGKIYSRANKELMSQGEARIAKGANRFLSALEHFGTNVPWVGMSKPTHIDYASLPSFVNDL